MQLLSYTLIAILWTLTSALQFRGADFSSLLVVEDQGIHFTDDGVQKPFETILASIGANIARIRVWTAGNYTLEKGLQLARRAKKAGMALLIDLHYSDTCTPFFLYFCSLANRTVDRGRPRSSSYPRELANRPYRP